MKKRNTTLKALMVLLIAGLLCVNVVYASEKNHDRDSDLWDGAAININNSHGEDVADLNIGPNLYHGWAGLTAVVIENTHPDVADAAGFWWNLHTQGSVDWSGMLTLYYDESNLGGIPETELTLLHDSGDGWVDMNGVVDPVANTITAFVTRDDFSPYVISRRIAPSDIVTPGDNNTTDQNLVSMTKADFPTSLVNYPNPFRPQTTHTNISFVLPTEQNVSLAIYDVTGKLVATLLKNDVRDQGSHIIAWDGTNERGDLVNSGVYFYQLRTTKGVVSERLTVLK